MLFKLNNFQNTQEVLPQNVQVAKEGRRLIIPSTSEENQGIFTCIVRNKVGESTQDFPLEITGKDFWVYMFYEKRDLEVFN